MLVTNVSLTTTAMSSSPVDRISGASTPTLLAMSSIASNRLHEELIGLKRWRQMYDSAMNEKNEELQKLQLVNQRQTQALNDSIAQIEQQTMTINSMKQNEINLEKKISKLEELHQILKKNVSKLEKIVSQCEFVRVDLERLYEHQERNVRTLNDRVDTTIEAKLENLKSQLKLVEQLHEQARLELNKQIQERTQDNLENANEILRLRTKINEAENEIHQCQMTNSHAQGKITELNEEIQKSQIFIENLLVEQNKELTQKVEEISNLNQRIEAFLMKLDSAKEEIFNLQETNRILQSQIDEMQKKSLEHSESQLNTLQTCQAEINIREKQNEQLNLINAQLNEQILIHRHEIEELNEKNHFLRKEIESMAENLQKQFDQTREEYQKQLNDFTKQSIEYDNRFEQHAMELNEKDRIINELKSKHQDIAEKMISKKNFEPSPFTHDDQLLKSNSLLRADELTEEEIIQLTKENEELRAQNQYLLQETDERTEQIKQKDVIVEATNIEIGEKDKEIEELKSKLTSVEERLSKNQNLLTSLRSSMGEKDAKIKRLEQGSTPSQPSFTSRSNAVRRANINQSLMINQQKSNSSLRQNPNSGTQTSSTGQPGKVNVREKRMLPPASSDLTPKKMMRLGETKAAIDQTHAFDYGISPKFEDDRDEVASNTSVASLFEYLKKI